MTIGLQQPGKGLHLAISTRQAFIYSSDGYCLQEASLVPGYNDEQNNQLVPLVSV